jgi:hypothetical protein
MSEMSGGDQRGSVIAAGDRLRVAAKLDRKPHHARIVLDGRNGDRVIAVVFQGVDVCPAGDESTDGVVMGLESRDMERRAAGLVTNIGVDALRQQSTNLDRIAARRGSVQARIGCTLARARRRLRLHGCRE